MIRNEVRWGRGRRGFQAWACGLMALAAMAASGADWSLQFNGSSQYATFGAATATLGAANFTIECWFKRTGAGATTTTGTGGITTVPLVAKGRGEADGSNKDCNYFFGITAANVLGADFEEGAGQTSPGLNHPVTGSTVIANDQWHHGAATFDGTTWRLYLNGQLDATLDLGPNRLPRHDSIQHASLASALTSAGTAAGYFAGRLDEVRVWNYARSQAEIGGTMRAKVVSAPGLLARWSLDAGTGTNIASSAGTTVNGTLVNTPTWNMDTPFALVPAGATWKYLDNGSDQGTAWRALGFDDSSWAAGPAELGYGDGGEATVVSYGPDPNNKYITTYFRTAFEVSNASRYSGLDLSLVRDDGAVVYLNDVEVWRSNMPEGEILYNTLASSPEVSGSDESKWFNASLPGVTLAEGQNVLAVEVHQQRVASSDISFNLKLAASRTDPQVTPPTCLLTAPAPGALLAVGAAATLAADATDDGSVTKVEFFVNGAKVGEDTEAPYAFDWIPAVPGRVSLAAKATDNEGATAQSAAVAATVYEPGTGAVQFDGVNDQVAFGQALSLGASNFTIECWMRKLGPGLTSSSGSGGVTAVPLITKGRGEAENSNVDCNYFFGLLPSGALAADFEQMYADGGGAAGQNYPVTGASTAPGDGAWHHVAATYDGSAWNLYVDGALDRTLNVGAHVPRYDSIQHAALATAMNSAGVPEGAFEGTLDEVRIWNYARSAEQIAAAMNLATPSAGGLLARWSLDEGAGTTAGNSVADQPDGALVNGPFWCLGRSLSTPTTLPPTVAITAPADGATLDAGSNLEIAATAGDDDGSVVSVSFLANGIEIGSDDTAPYAVVWTAVPAGTHALRAVATDNDGLSATSEVVTVTASVRNDPPVFANLLPADGATLTGTVATLSVTVTDPEGQPVDVRLYGRPRRQQPPAADFTVAVLPDTQYYTKSYPHLFIAQTDWLVAQRQALNLAYVAHLGDITEDAVDPATQWANAVAALSRLEDPITTGLSHGIPYGVVPGNHDHTSGITYFNQHFGPDRFAGRPYYGGHFGTENRNHYDLVSAGGMDFLFVYVDWNYGSLPNYAELNAWANGVIQSHPNRRAVVISHAIVDTAANFDANNGQALFNAVKGNTNLFLMLNGHYHGEAQRIESVGGRRIDICLSDYQGYANGGNGFLRLYQFSPSNNLIRVRTYSPTLNQYETDANSQFEIPYAMSAPPDTTPYTLLASSNGMASGGTLLFDWSGLAEGSNYEWYVEATDGVNTRQSATRGFATATPPEPVVNVSNPYAGVNWATVTRAKGNLHTHTTNSDGSQTPAARIDEYDNRNYDVLALTDHDFVTYPWTAYGRDPAALGMVAIQGNELSQGHHIVSLFNGYASSSSDETVLLTGVGAAGGLALFAHPGRYTQTAQWYANHYLAHPHCIGQEIYNQGDRYPNDRAKWDEVLSLLMPARPVWGFSNDDAHTVDHIGRNRTYFLVEALTEANVRAALEDGAFYATYSASSANIPPAITNVAIDEIAGTITVQGTGCTQVRWISQGAQVATGETLDLVNTPGIAKYVRAELHGPEGIAYSNPFGVTPTGNQPPTVSAGPDAAVTLPNAATLNGSASDDGLPNPPDALTLLWEKVSGPGSVAFANSAAAQTTAAFSEAGTYVLRLTANDGALQASDETTVTVSNPSPGNWTACNDCSPGSGQLTYHITTIGLNQSGTLLDYDTGNPIGVTLQIVNNPAAPANAGGTGGPMPNSGTDAYNTFNGKVSFANVIWYGNSGWWVDAVFSGLDPNKEYEFATSVNRGNSSYTTRWTKFTISGIESAEQSSTPGVQVNSPTSVSFWSGYNTVNGHVARWTKIKCGADGSFTVRAEADGQYGHATREAYAFDGILLRESAGAPAPLSLTLSEPAEGASFAANRPVALAAQPAGGAAPYTVEFYTNRFGGAFGLAGTAGAAPYQLNLGPLAPGSYSVYAVATDGATDTVVSATNAFTVTTLLDPTTNSLIAAGSSWKYLDNGSDQGAAWRAPAFDDSGWAQGPAPLGYGDPWIVTTVYSPPAPNRYITTYFRKEFTVADPSAFSALDLAVMRDDGAVVYLNGVEVFRSNMPEGPIDYQTFSSTIVGGADETAFFRAAVSPALLVPGANVLAVEVHQRDGTSSDLGFDLRLTGTTPAGDLNQAPLVDAGGDQVVVLPAAAALNGSVSDDGLPPPAALTVQWSQVSGPGTASFADPAAAATTATFSEPGVYVLRLSASDGAKQSEDDCAVTVCGIPSVAIADPAAETVVVPNGTAVVALSGSAAHAAGVIALANSLGGSATAPAGDVWSFADVPLAVGVNQITITVSNLAGMAASDKLTVIRQAEAATNALRLAVFSDPHYFATNLLIADGPAFQMYLAQDRKLIKESAAITKAVVDRIIAANPNVVLVPGDLTKDGEYDSHVAFAGELARLEAAGAQVLVVPGNHDIDNPHACAYDGASTIPAPNVSLAQFRTIYADFGYDLAVAADPNSAAYTVALTPDITLVCMDACQYGATAGAFDAARLGWIESQLAAARAQGKPVLGMMHHGLMEHFQGQKSLFPEYVLDGYETVAPLFANYGMRAVFTGHFHANDVVAGTIGGRTIYDIETGSTVTWPCPYRVMELDEDGNLALVTHHIEAIDFDLGGAPDFQTYAFDYLESGLLAISSYMLQAPPYNLPPATADYLAPAVTEALIRHYEGDEPGLAGASPATQAIVMNLLGSGDPLQIMLGQAIYAILLDLPPEDNNLTLDLDWPPSQYWLDTEATVGGTVDVADGWYDSGASVTVTATAVSGYVFTDWTGTIQSAVNPLVVPMSQAHAVTARFAPLPSLAITAPLDGAALPAEQASVAVTVEAAHVVDSYTYANLTLGVTATSAAITAVLPLGVGPNTLTVSATGSGGVALSDTVTVTRAAEPDRPLTLGVAGSLSVPNGEIVAYDAASRRAFVTCQSQGIQIVDLSAPFAPAVVGTALAGETVNSVAAKNGLVAAAVENATPSDPGAVAFLDAAGTVLNRVTVGIQPDMVTFTPDGSKVLTANEAETGDHADYGAGSVSVIDLSGGVGAATVTTVGFEAFDAQTNALRAAGVRLFPGRLPSVDFEPEYIAVAPDGLTAMVTLQENNALATLDLATLTFTQIVPLGLKDHSLPGNGLDASDQDGPAIRIANWPVFGMYMPDAIASFSAGGQTYYVIANEGDARDAAGEAARIGHASMVLDPTAFPDAATLKQNANLGRLNASKLDGDLDGDGDLDRLHVYGGRSFSILRAAGAMVFDSGDELEQITADLTPTLFNANDGLASKFDQRSDDKGCEPEGVEIGVIEGCTYAFVALERAGGGVMVYDVSRPEDPLFVQYIRRDGDVAPEGLKFVPAEDSPSGKALLLVANENSQTLTVYELELGANLRVLTPDASVDATTATCTIEGRFRDIPGDIVWSNALSGATGVAVKGAGTWSATVPLAVGVNTIEVRGMGQNVWLADRLVITRRQGPIPDIRANGSDGPVTIGAADTLSVTLDLDGHGYAGVWADWWVLAYHADSGQWYQYVAPFTTSSWRLWTGGTSLQAPLVDVAGHEALRMSGLSAGEWTFYFGVDAPRNGLLDFEMLFSDSVSVTVTP